MPTPLQSFDGVPNLNNVLPSDANGDIGYDPSTNKKYYVQWVNTSFEIWDVTSTPVSVYGPANGNTLWSGTGTSCQTQNDGDVIALFDTLANRWLMSQFALPNGFSGPFYQCIAISQTANPVGPYNRYTFLVNNSKMNDYPKFGVWPDGYYMSVNQFDALNNFLGTGAYVFDRANLLTGVMSTFQYVDTCPTNVNCSLGGMLPSHLGGTTPPPAGSPNYFIQADDDAQGYPQDRLEIWAFHVDWSNPGNSTFTNQTNLATASFSSNMCNYTAYVCIPQPSTSVGLDALADRLMYRLQYRNFGDHESLVVNHTVAVGDYTNHAGIRWYELRRSGGSWSIYQQSTYSPDSDNRWMGSMAMNGQGDMALGYSVSSSSVYPSIRYASRLAGDSLNQLTQAEATLIAGGGSQTHSSGRWGDYTSMSVDPVDNCTFWYTNQYYSSTSSGSWKTRIGSFKLIPPPVPPPPLGPFVYYFPVISKAGPISCY